MRPSNKSRSRNKNNNRRPSGNVVNRVFDSSGPEGKVRGTPQQIIEKYTSLARDAQLSGDRVGAENFQQHAEHYTRLLGEAMKEAAERREQQEAQAAERREQDAQRRAERDAKREQNNKSQGDEKRQPEAEREPVESASDDVVDIVGTESLVVDTPESAGGSDEPAEVEH